MQRKYLFLIIAIVVITLVAFFSPKHVGGPLCGPVCPDVGLSTYLQSCFGFKVTRSFIDGFSVDCYGLPIGEKKCFGVPYTEGSGSKNIQLDCNYPCNDDSIKNMCQTQENLTFDGLVIHCEALNRKCDW